MSSPIGFLVLDKPAGITSREAVDHALAWFPRCKAGHAGTLDPAATGVLVIGIGPTATRLIEYVQDQEKVYHSTFHLGGTSTTDDAEGEITLTPGATAPSEATLREALQAMIGPIQQTPPAFSAARVQGVRAHTKARKGQTVVLQPRTVSVYELNLVRYAYPEVEVSIRCSKGTYIRSIARDLGSALGVGGYVQRLRRTRIGLLTCEQAVAWNASADDAANALLPLTVAVQHLQRMDVTAEQAWRMQCGQAIPCDVSNSGEGDVALWRDQRFLGIARVDANERVIRPVKMIDVWS